MTATSTRIELTPEQRHIHDAAIAFYAGKTKDIRIGGYAGTGKSTLTAEIARTLRAENKKIKIAFACFTGKAAYVLRTKLTAAGLESEDYVGTIHGLMYEPVVKQGVIIRWRRRPEIEADLLVVDEASMVGEQVWNDLKRYKLPIIAVGDHGQLPPIGSTFSLMDKPDFALERIHRQAEGNPIIALSVRARLEGRIEPERVQGGGEFLAGKMNIRMDEAVEGVKDIQNTLFLCGRNSTRIFVNRRIRARLGYGDASPMKGERVICLKNNREVGIFNGMGGVIQTIKPSMDLWYDARITMDDGTLFDGTVIKDQFGSPKTLREHPKIDPKDLRDLFDWGYCLTVHKAQGSEADNVVLFEERFDQMSDDDWRRWLYTGITRARKKLMIVGK